MTDLTPRQTQILRLIQDAIAENGMPPTRAEISRILGFKSPNAAEEHLRALQRKGVIDLIPGASRGIQLKDILREQLGLPLIGRVAAGRPILAEEHIETRYQIDPQLFQPKPHYLLKVQGMSMKNAGILHGDLVAGYDGFRCADAMHFFEHPLELLPFFYNALQALHRLQTGRTGRLDAESVFAV